MTFGLNDACVELLKKPLSEVYHRFLKDRFHFEMDRWTRWPDWYPGCGRPQPLAMNRAVYNRVLRKYAKACEFKAKVYQDLGTFFLTCMDLKHDDMVHRFATVILSDDEYAAWKAEYWDGYSKSLYAFDNDLEWYECDYFYGLCRTSQTCD